MTNRVTIKCFPSFSLSGLASPLASALTTHPRSGHAHHLNLPMQGSLPHLLLLHICSQGLGCPLPDTDSCHPIHPSRLRSRITALPRKSLSEIPPRPFFPPSDRGNYSTGPCTSIITVYLHLQNNCDDLRTGPGFVFLFLLQDLAQYLAHLSRALNTC